MDDWDPQRYDFEDQSFNSYIRGPGRNLSVKKNFVMGTEKHVQLYVTGIPQELTKDGLMSLFGRAGTVVRAKILVSRKENVQDTFGFVTMATLSEAERAIAQFDKFRVGKFTLKVSVALTREELERKKQLKRDINLMTARGFDEDCSDSESSDRVPNDKPKVTNGFGGSGAATSAIGAGRGQKLKEMTQEMLRQQYLSLYNSIALPPPQGVSPSPRGVSKKVSPAGDGRPQFGNLSVQVDRDGRGFQHDPARQYTPGGQGKPFGRGRLNQDDYGSECDYGGYPSNSRGRKGRGGQGRGSSRYGKGGYYENWYDSYDGGYEYEGGYGGYQQPCMGRGMYMPAVYVDPYVGMMGAPHLLQPAMMTTPMMNPAMQQQTSLPLQTPIQQTVPRSNQAERSVNSLRQECSVCGKLGMSRCSNCKVPYCGRPCQEKDWPEHKFVCGTITKEKKDTEAFKDFEVDAGDELIPQVKELMEKVTGETIQIKKKPEYSPHSGSDSGSYRSETRRDERRGKGQNDKERQESAYKEKGEDRTSRKMDKDVGSQRSRTGDKGSGRKDDKTCFNCGESSHLRSECPMPANFNADCYNCHQRGHLSKECPLKQGKEDECFNCHKPGHFSKECPENEENRRQTGATDRNMNIKQKTTSPSVNTDEKWDDDPKPVSNQKAAKPSVEAALRDGKVATKRKTAPSPPPKKSLPFATMPLNEEITVVITDVQDPQYFYVQMAVEEVALQFQDLMALMHQTFSSSSLDVTEVLQGEIYGVKFSFDGSWNRAQVVKVSGDQVLVQFLDFGNKEMTTVENMRQLTNDMMKLPAQGVLCALEGILPKSGKSWNIANTELINYLTPDKPFRAVCKKVMDSNNEKVNMIVLRGTDGVNVAKALVSADLVKVAVSESTGVETVSPKAQQRSAASPSSAQFQRNLSDSNQGSKTERIIYAKDVPKWVDQLTVGEECLLMVADSRSPTDFSIQVLDEENIAKFTAFNEEFNEECSRSPETEYRPQAVGELVASKFSQIEGWYRAEVQEIQSEGVRVLYIDYLNSEVVTFKMLRKAITTWAGFPAQGIACCLYGILEPPDGRWLPEVMELYGHLSQTALKGTVREIKNGVVSMELNELSGESVNEKIKHILSKDVKKPASVKGKISPGKLPVNESKVQASVRGKINPGELPLDGSKVQALVTDVSAIDTVYIQVLDPELERKRNEMMLALNQSLTTYSPSDSFEPKEGDFVAAVYSTDGNALWYRGKVMAIMSENNYMVLFIDYGNTDCVPVEAIAPLELRFMSLPAMAVRCQLAGSEDVTDSQTLLNLKSLTDHKMYVKAVDFVKDIFKVEMLLMDGTNVNEAFEFKRGKSPAKSETRTPSQEADTYISHFDIAESSLPMDGTKVSAKAVLTESLASFYVHKLDKEMDEKLMECLKEMQVHYKDDDHIYSGKDGEYVAALFDDGSGAVWYRAKIIQTVGNDVKVSIIDYGNVGLVAKECIRRLDKKFTDLPAVAIKCKLNGCTGEELPSVIEEFSSVETTTIKVHALSKVGNTYLVNLHLFDPVETSVAECLGLIPEQSVKMTSEKLPESDASSVSKSPVSSRQSVSPASSMQITSPVSEVHSTLQVSSLFQDLSVLKDLVLPLGTDIPAVTYVIDSIRSFYIQMADDETQAALAAMMLELAEACQNDKKEHQASAGEIVAALFTEGGDSNWYRGQVFELIDKNQCKVMFVDYGNTETVLFRDVRRLETRFLSLPKMAVHCSLFGSGEETEDMLQKFKGISNVPMTLHAKSLQNGTYEVEVTLADNRNINQELGLVSAAAAVKSPVISTDIVDNLPKAVTPASDRLPRKVSSPPKGERKAIFSQTLTKCRPDTNEFKAIITSAVRPNLFHCQVFPESDQTTLQELQFLSETMQLECEVEFDDVDKLNFEVGELCCAKFPVDNVWYRATVLEVFPDKTVKVEYVDFGNQTEVPVNQLRPVTEDYTRLPLLAFRCLLHGVCPAESSWTQAALVEMSKFQDKPLVAKVISIDNDIYELDLTDPSTNVNVAEHLISAGLAKAKDDDIQGLSEVERLKRENELLQRQVHDMHAKMAAVHRSGK